MIENYFSAEDVSEFRIWLDYADRFVVISHMSPDGDAIGSSLALCRYLRSLGKEAVAVVPDSPPDFLCWLPGIEGMMIYDSDPEAVEKVVYQADVVCCLDFNVVRRIDKVAACFLYTKARKILIDHHPYPGATFNVILSYPEASSTAELVFHFICALGGFRNIDYDTAVCLYTGMMTDTGAFTYNSNSSCLFNVISLLLETGIDKDRIYSRVYNTFSESRLRLQGYVLNEKMQVFPEMSTALITLTGKELRRFNARKGDTEGFVNMPLQIKGIMLSVLIREEKDNLRLSFRSAGSVPCNILASEWFHGGGHTNASGAEFQGSMEEAVALFFEAMESWRTSEKENIRQLFKK
ncbi:MAG: bifunctional oligoribonuclease/PAP phosphatase NrnA [Bacteroidaceae bacterium]|nr:bifunctional oligoribonuclease/PAP phosphatase NrnA [Bacteroidaceae bacterium]MBO7588415.1 bifunctional oligoribonuclease/PAP phosphatase NrnA [Bacteroidaceae bacterium]MBP5646859.1 bifunctional oligoribonuclease/PAP phosphatase NrnA [Bacteroidaceae bacterium]